MDEEEKSDLNLNEVWHACRKIQTAIFRYGINLTGELCVHDNGNKGLISESLFTSVLAKYKSIFGMSDFELREITDYFRLRDGRVAYRQFCKVVCSEPNDKGAKMDISSGLEWNDPMHVNVLPRPEDRRRLCLILIKIAQISHLPLYPYFQDYELVSKTVGTVSIAHFSRVLHFMKIPLSDDDFLLLLKRYMKDAYMVNYVAFIQHIDNILNYLKEHNLLDHALKIIGDFPGRLVDLELPQLPPVDGTQLALDIFPDRCNHPKKNKTDCEVIFCIQKHIHKNRVRVSEFLEGFDHLHTGTITKNQFERGLYNMGIGQFISQRDIGLLCTRYVCPIDTNRVMWREFEDEIDRVFTVKNLDKMPQLEVISPPTYISEMPRVGAMDWDTATPEVRDICEEALTRIQTRIRVRRLHLHPFFKTYDRLNSGHVTCGQSNQVFRTNGILLTPAELTALHDRYGNQLGFNYSKFLEDADPAEFGIPQMGPATTITAECPNIDEKEESAQPSDSEDYMVSLLSNAKRQAIVRSIAVLDFMQDYDRHRENEILETDFRRGLDNAGIKLAPEEINYLCKHYRSPSRGCCTLYRDFCKALDNIFIELETSTGDDIITAVPLLHLANLDGVNNFLNFDERVQCSQALMKLARKPDEISNLRSVFKDFDREQCGTIRKNQLVRALTVRDMHYMISAREFDAVYKCFGVSRGLQVEFNYREFLNVLSVLHQTGQVKRNY